MESLKKCNPTVVLPLELAGPSPKIILRTSPVHGHGIFAKAVIGEGELIEETKLLKLSWRTKIIQDSVMVNYAWLNSECECAICKQDGFEQYIAFGYGSVYNHSKQPNTRVLLDFVTETMRVYSIREIGLNEEVFVSYGAKFWIMRDFWKKAIGESANL